MEKPSMAIKGAPEAAMARARSIPEQAYQLLEAILFQERTPTSWIGFLFSLYAAYWGAAYLMDHVEYGREVVAHARAAAGAFHAKHFPSMRQVVANLRMAEHPAGQVANVPRAGNDQPYCCIWILNHGERCPIDCSAGAPRCVTHQRMYQRNVIH
jgi:hypothetical protein